MNTKHTHLALILTALLLSSCAGTGSSSGNAASSSLTGVKPYPLKVCLVTGNDLNSMGDQQVHNYGSQQLKFCCEACWDKFQKNPGKYLAKLK